MAVAADVPAVTPSLDEVRALAADYNLIPLRHTFIDDCETPVSAFLKLREEGPAFLLESADQGQRVGRYSFIGYRPRRLVRWSLGDEGIPTTSRRARSRAIARPRCPTCRRSPVARSACSATTSCEPLSRSRTRIRTPSGCRTSR
jgi:anthranilate synthase component 1